MRIWSLHPRYLDARGLVALWREGLLAQAVLAGKTKGYVHHPQLLRFQEQPSPVGFIAQYLRGVHSEAVDRGYRFDAGKIDPSRTRTRIPVTRGQLELEWQHLMGKLETRDPKRHARLGTSETPQVHPLFRVIEGGVAEWERAAVPRNQPLQRPRRKRRVAER